MPFESLIDHSEQGSTWAESLEDFPTVTREQVVAALEEAGEAVVAHAGSAGRVFAAAAEGGANQTGSQHGSTPIPSPFTRSTAIGPLGPSSRGADSAGGMAPSSRGFTDPKG